MSITTSDEYFAVRIDSPMGRMLVWNAANPGKVPGTKKTNEVYWAMQKVARLKAREDYDRDYAILKAAGLHKERRFQYEETAKKWAAQIKEETGVEVRVSRQFDLAL